MNLVYVALYNGNEKSGAVQKIIAQVKELNLLGINAKIVFLTKEGSQEFYGENVEFLLSNTPPYRNVLKKIMGNFELCKTIQGIIDESGDETVIYHRSLFLSPTFAKLLAKPRKCKFVFEEQGVLSSERNSFIYSFLEKPILSAIVRNVDGYVAVSSGIREHIERVAKNRVTPSVVIPNGFKVGSVKMRMQPNYDGRMIHVLSLSSINRWHGLDRFLKGLKNSDDKNIRLHIVGPEEKARELLRKFYPESKSEVEIHGFLSGMQLDSLFDLCHVALGSLAIHRAGAGAPLKSREYCARGIPFVDSAEDDDFDDQLFFRKKIKSSESAIDISFIRDFVNYIYRVDNHCQKIRDFALERLDWSSKAKQLKNFLEYSILHRRS